MSKENVITNEGVLLFSTEGSEVLKSFIQNEIKSNNAIITNGHKRKERDYFSLTIYNIENKNNLKNEVMEFLMNAFKRSSDIIVSAGDQHISFHDMDQLEFFMMDAKDFFVTV